MWYGDFVGAYSWFFVWKEVDSVVSCRERILAADVPRHMERQEEKEKYEVKHKISGGNGGYAVL